MSWDVFVMRVPAHITSIDQIPDDFRPEPLGTVRSVRAVINDVVALVAGPGFSLEVSLDDDDDDAITDGVALFFRGGGNAAHAAVMIAERLGARAMDGLNGFLDLDAAKDSFWKWQRYRDQIVRGG